MKNVILFIVKGKSTKMQGWGGFTGVHQNKNKAIERLYSEKKHYLDKAELVDYKTLKVLATYEKTNKGWHRKVSK